MVQLYGQETKLNGQEDIVQYHDLVAELGLSGQENVIIDTNKAPVPYKWLNAQQMNVVGTLCPRRVDYKDYSLEPLPIEVLEQIKKCVENGYFHTMKIYYTDVDPDPFLIGFLGGYYYKNNSYKNEDKIMIESVEDFKNKPKNSFISDEKPYAIARWGDEKRTWEELTEKAREAWIKQESVEANRAIRDAQRKLEDLEADAFNMFQA
jgi:sulfur carrier protein ThiS